MATNISVRFAKFLHDLTFADVSFDCQGDDDDDGEVLRGHKLRLAIDSVLLRMLFKYNPQDSGGHYKLSRQELSLVYDWSYHRQKPNGCTLDVILLADYWNAGSLLKSCLHSFIGDGYDVSKYATLLRLCHLQLPMRKQLVGYLTSNFKEGVTANMDELCALPLDAMEDILSQDDFYVHPESFLWSTLKYWLSSNWQARSNALDPLTKYIKWGVLTMTEFRQIRRDLMTMANGALTGDMKQLLDKVYRYQRWKHSLDHSLIAPDMEVYTITPRVGRRCAFAIGGWSQHMPSNEFEMYDEKVDTWYKVPGLHLPGPRAYHGAVCTDSKLYIAGGFAGDERFKSVLCLDLETLKWQSLPALDKERCFVSTVVVNHQLYCMGGFDGTNEARRLSTSEKLDLATNQWTMLPDLTVARSDAGAVVHNGNVYIAGGFNGNEYLRTVEVLMADSTEWKELPLMNSKRGGVACVVFRNRLYAIGGCDGTKRLNTVESIDLLDNDATWQYEPNMMQGRSNFGACSLDDRIVVAGGYIHPSTTAKIEWFDGFNWYNGEDLNKRMSAFSLTVLPVTPAIKQLMEKDLENVIQQKRSKRLTALETVLQRGNVEELNDFLNAGSSGMFDSFIVGDEEK